MDILKICDVTKRYAGHTALDKVNISVPKQSIFGLLGPNGAGKTTLIRIITNIIGADSGKIYFDNEQLSVKHIRSIGYLPEERGLYKKMKVGEQLLYLAQLKGMSKGRALEKLKTWCEKFELTAWWNKNVEDLSKGMQQKVQFISTILHEPKLIILDEPFSGFDPINVNLVTDEILQLRENGSTIIFSTHRMESVEELCDHIALINKSKTILEGSLQEIKDRNKTNTYIVVGRHLYRKADDNGKWKMENGDDCWLPLKTGFKIISVEWLEDDYFKATIKITSKELNTKDLLVELLNSVEIHNFNEKIPGINDIFIAEVS